MKAGRQVEIFGADVMACQKRKDDLNAAVINRMRVCSGRGVDVEGGGPECSRQGEETSLVMTTRPFAVRRVTVIQYK